jgi:Predicted ATPase involved in replication control, Cdc46/Mcm family
MPIKISTTVTKTGPRFAEAISFPIKCPKCGHETKQSIAGLKDDPLLVCSSCSETFKIESGGTARGVADDLDKLDRAWDNLIKS